MSDSARRGNKADEEAILWFLESKKWQSPSLAGLVPSFLHPLCWAWSGQNQDTTLSRGTGMNNPQWGSGVWPGSWGQRFCVLSPPPVGAFCQGPSCSCPSLGTIIPRTLEQHSFLKTGLRLPTGIGFFGSWWKWSGIRVMMVVNILKMEPYTSKGWILGHVNYISIL